MPKIKLFLKYLLIIPLVFIAIAIFSALKTPTENSNQTSIDSKSPIEYQPSLANVPFERQKISIDPAISQKFSISEIKNIPDMEKAYGFKFTKDELAKLEQNKFVIKNLLDTNISGGKEGLAVSEQQREFVALYFKILGDSDYKNRNQANSIFISSDSMMNLFSILSADLLKETENKYLSDQTLSMTKVLYDQASKNLAKAVSADERNEWTKVRNYFAIPYALLSTSIKPITADDYWKLESTSRTRSLEDIQAEFDLNDKDADSFAKATEFVKKLKLGSDNEVVVLADLKQAYEASEPRGKINIFGGELNSSSAKVTIQIPFTLFKPRGTYTSSSLRRQYFRAVQWYQQVPFLLSDNNLTDYAVRIGGLIKDNPEIGKQYESFSSLIAFIVGESDDLDVSDYAAAVSDLGADKVKDQKVLREYLSKRKPDAKIKALPVSIDPTAGVTVADEMDAMKGMRFMSQKFIPDSYWTGKLTQGDEAAAVNGLRLPGQASSLEVMSILGSPYATKHLSDLPFYAEHSKAIDSRLSELKSESAKWNEDYWKSNLYTSTLWTVSGMFGWLKENKATLPQFMQSPLWDAKTLLTASGFWTELRHTSILYAKQSFAEKGGGGGDSCDPRKVPEPAKSYVEPQAEAYDRLFYTAKRLLAEYNARGFTLKNSSALEKYIALLDTIREYTKLELENTKFEEEIIEKKRQSGDDNKECVEYYISPKSLIDRHNNLMAADSRWEELRTRLVQQMNYALPSPIEGPIIEIKDKRAAVVADIHTDDAGGILEEGTGVPRVIFVAVKDINGPRLTVGFTYSQYETISSTRLTDEEWQDQFYTDSNSNYLITYKPKSSWPDINEWYIELLGNK